MNRRVNMQPGRHMLAASLTYDVFVKVKNLIISFSFVILTSAFFLSLLFVNVIIIAIFIFMIIMKITLSFCFSSYCHFRYHVFISRGTSMILLLLFMIYAFSSLLWATLLLPFRFESCSLQLASFSLSNNYCHYNCYFIIHYIYCYNYHHH